MRTDTRRNPSNNHKARLYRSYDSGYVIECSCTHWSMVGGSQKGLRSAHAVHCAENGQPPAWLVRLVGLDGGTP